ncbi:MAG: hypothetical protein H6607_06855 [Flavobacteriales bacterium]|nr:hypothetical protein [Flavobacteriales bacterium]
MKKYVGLVCIMLLGCATVYAQNMEVPLRLPVYGKFFVAQKFFPIPEVNVPSNELSITFERTHNVGVGFGTDFFLMNPQNRTNFISLSTTLQLGSYTTKYSATMPGPQNGFSSDIDWNYQLAVLAYEGTMGLNFNHKKNEKLLFTLGAALGVQDFNLNPDKLTVSKQTIINGQFEQVIIVGSNGIGPFGFPNPTPRSKQNIAFNPVFSLNISHILKNDNIFSYGVRVCSATDPFKEVFEFRFGHDSHIVASKSYFALDLAYSFSMNKKISEPLN